MNHRARRRRRRRRHPLRTVAISLVALAACALAVTTAVLGAWAVGVVDDTPDLVELHPRPQPSVSAVYGAAGARLGFIAGDVLRVPLHGRGVPWQMRDATVAIEDRRFYDHGGIDVLGAARAAVEDTLSGRTVQGGSTLAMQLVRNLYLPRSRFQRTLERKLREAKLASELEDRHSKRWILAQYLDDVPYGTVGGQTALGVQAAARVFFDRPAARLTLPQAALLAGLPQAPTLDNPFLHPRRARQRRAEVLAAMASTGAITPAQQLRAARTPLGVHRNGFYAQRSDPYVVDAVAHEIARRWGPRVLARGGLRITTSIDPRLQALGHQAITDHLSLPGQPSAALVSVDPADGRVRALVNSTSYADSQFDAATSAHRQPGSTFKTIDLMAAVREGVDPRRTTYVSRPLAAGWQPLDPSWSVATDDGRYHGSIDLAEAIALSDNTVYAQLGADLGGAAIVRAARDMGVSSPLDGYPAEAIGGLRVGVTALEMADAYATVADGGWRATPTLVDAVRRDGATLAPRRPAQRVQTFSDGQTAEVTDALEGVLDHGTAAGLGIGCPAAGKTGTTSSFTDAWFVGYTPALSTSVWVGYPSETTSMSAVPGYGEVFGATIPAPIWQQYMEGAIGSACEPFPAPREPFAARPFDGAHQSAPGEESPTTTNSTTVRLVR